MVVRGESVVRDIVRQEAPAQITYNVYGGHARFTRTLLTTP
ncbi:hypothetical protein GME_15720 [Halomonas sp. TD01]|nr:hypothetical protein GME_15720 [Halomonas sp. TD01]